MINAVRWSWSILCCGVAAILLCGSMMALGQGNAASKSGEDIAIHLTADAKGAGTPLVHFWSKVAGSGRANEGLRATWQEELAMAGKYDGFRYIRFHGIFHDDMWVYREDKEGRPLHNFQYIDDLYDRMLAKGIRHKYVDNDGKPLFPFGYGLSYTSFRYDDLAVQVREPGSKGNVSAKVKITNTGNREGMEVAQLYLREDACSVETPDRALKGFTRVTLKSGESKTVSFQVRQETSWLYGAWTGVGS